MNPPDSFDSFAEPRGFSERDFDLDASVFAGFWLRVGATLVDMLIVVPFVVASYFTPLPVYIVLSFLILLYKPVLEGLYGATVGKFAVGIRVINEEGARIGLVAALIRHVFGILSFIPGFVVAIRLMQEGLHPFAFSEAERLAQAMEALEPVQMAGNFFSFLWLVAVVWVAFHARKRGLHDLIAGTYVIEKPNT